MAEVGCHCYTLGKRRCRLHGDSTALPLNVFPIATASAGRRIARRALDAEETDERCYQLERAVVSLLDRAQQMRRELELTGELRWEATGEALDLCA